MNRMTRFISLLLAAALLYLGAGGALAETATEPALNFKVLPGLMEGQQANPAERNIFDKPEEVAAYCEKIYGYIDPELVGNFFYGGPEEMTDLMKQLYKAIVGVDDIFIDRGLDLCSTFYAYVWEILHMEELPAQAKSRPAIKETMKAVFSEFPAEGVPAAADICIDYIVQYEPEIEDAAYSQYGDGIRTVEGDEEYRKNFQEGFALFDEGRLEEAVEAYKKCLEIKENDPLATFEIVEAYIAMRDYESAKSWLAQIAPYLEGNEYKAQWFRRQGFMAIEEGDYQLAYALYAYSTTYEDGQAAHQEMDYIRSVAPDTQVLTEEKAKAYLEEHGF